MSLSVMFVAAHPDDETFGIGGSIALHAGDADLRFVLVHATDGAAGEVAPDVEVPPDGLGALRRAEDEESWRMLGRPPDRHEWLGFDDGKLPDQADELEQAVARIIAEERPDVVATFGPDGVTGHPDHVAVGAATTRAFDTIAAEGGPGLRRLLHAALPNSLLERLNRQRARRGLFEWDPQQPFHLRGVAHETIGITVDTSSVRERVLLALRTHRSQWSYEAMPGDRPLLDAFSREYWVIARPAALTGLTDIFEGL